MLTFAIGIVTGAMELAIIGIVYSYITAAAMWENFRARLPYLYDPWSEKLPRPADADARHDFDQRSGGGRGAVFRNAG